VNAAILILTSALMAGDNPEKVPAPSGSGGNAPVASACGGGCGGCGYNGCGCGSYCDSCYEHGLLSGIRGRFRHNDCGCDCGCDNGPSFLDRIRERFRHDDCCCQPSCCQPTCHTSCCQPTCHTSCCTSSCYSNCSSCDCGCGQSFRERLRGMFRRHNDCCDSCGGCYSGCGNGCCGGAIQGKPGSSGEVVPLPKGSGTGSNGEVLQKLPTGDPVPAIPPGISKETPY
jgi:hypothetical protein